MVRSIGGEGRRTANRREADAVSLRFTGTWPERTIGSRGRMIPFHDDLGRRGPTPIVYGLAALWFTGLCAVHLHPGAFWQEWAGSLTVGGRTFEQGLEALHRGRGDGAAKALLAVVAPTLLHPLCFGGPVPTLFGVFAVIAFGGRIEAALGSRGFAAWLVIVSVAGTLGTRLWGGPGHVLLGAGPLLAAIAVAFLVAHPRARLAVLVPVVVIPVRATLPAAFVAFVLLVLQVGPVARFLQPFEADPAGPGAFLGAGCAGVVAGLVVRRTAARRGA
jgi:hypothetical protein